MIGHAPLSSAAISELLVISDGSIHLDSIRALPLGGTTALTNAIVFDSTRALPLAGAIVLSDPIAFDSVRALPLGGSATLVLPVAMGSGAALPFGGSRQFSTRAPSVTDSGARRLQEHRPKKRAWTLAITLPRVLFIGDPYSTVVNPRRVDGRLPLPALRAGVSRPAPLEARLVSQWSLHCAVLWPELMLLDGRSVATEPITLDRLIGLGLLEVLLG